MTRTSRTVPIALIALALVACGVDDETTSPTVDPTTTLASSDPTTPTSAPTTPAPPTTGEVTMPPSSTEPPDPGTTPTTNLRDHVLPPKSAPSDAQPPVSLPAGDNDLARAQAHLSDLLGIDVAEIEVVSQEEVTWPNGAIGCPQPDMMYTQALVDGSRIVLSVDDIEYHYHRGGSRDLFYCPQGS